MRDIVVFNLQRAIQCAIDIAFHIVSSEKLGLAANLKESFLMLNKNHIIDHDICKKLCNMVGFRNIVVHEYEEINYEILEAIVRDHLQDIEEFYTAIVHYYDIA